MELASAWWKSTTSARCKCGPAAAGSPCLREQHASTQRGGYRTQPGRCSCRSLGGAHFSVIYVSHVYRHDAQNGDLRVTRGIVVYLLRLRAGGVSAALA